MSKLEEDECYVWMALRRVSPNKNENTGLTKKSYRFVQSSNDTNLDMINMLHNVINIQEGSWRMYRTVNKRSFTKARKQLLIDLINMPEIFTSKIGSHWKSILMKSGTKVERNFLFDFDSNDSNIEQLFRTYLLSQKDCTIIDEFKTPNGRHFVTNPFYWKEGKEFNFHGTVIELKKDALVYIGSVIN